jgi:hypothetical protein
VVTVSGVGTPSKKSSAPNGDSTRSGDDSVAIASRICSGDRLFVDATDAMKCSSRFVTRPDTHIAAGAGCAPDASARITRS